MQKEVDDADAGVAEKKVDFTEKIPNRHITFPISRKKAPPRFFAAAKIAMMFMYGEQKRRNIVSAKSHIWCLVRNEIEIPSTSLRSK